MTNITNKLIAVLVPEDAYDFDLSFTYGIDYCHLTEHGQEVTILRGSEDLFGKAKIIGTITKSGEFSFDCEKYVDKQYGWYQTYTKENNCYHCQTKEESFISLLNNKEIFLEELNNQKILILEHV